jgi:RNA polymerase sigma-70 factor, ECF subfamily
MTFDAFYSKYFETAWRALAALGVAMGDLPDVTQEVFVHVYRQFKTFDGGDGGAAWVRAFCVNAARNWRRLGRNRLEANDDAAIGRVVDQRRDPESDVLAKDQQRLLFRALDALPPKQREVFVLFELEQMAAPEIAALLRIPLGTCYSRLRLGREAFRAQCEVLTHEQP